MKLTVQKKITTKHDNGYSYTYDISIDGKALGKYVTGIDLKMDAGLKPRLTINCVPDEIDVDVETLTALNVLENGRPSDETAK